jgi:hypothetical protein
MSYLVTPSRFCQQSNELIQSFHRWYIHLSDVIELIIQLYYNYEKSDYIL